MIPPWYWSSWAVVLASLAAGFLVALLGRRLLPLWHIVNIVAIALYLCACLATLLSSTRFEQDIALAGLQLGIAAAILLAASYRLHLVGVLICVAGSGGMAAFRILAAMAHPLSAYDLEVLMVDVASVCSLAALWPCLHPELRRAGMAMHRGDLRARQAGGDAGA